MAEAERLERQYWQAVTRYLEAYQESAVGTGPDQSPIYRSAAQATRAAIRLRADAAAASERARQARDDAQSAARRLNAARAALEQARPWQWRTRARLRSEAAREQQRLGAARHTLGECSASMELSTRKARDAERAAVALRRSDRAHRAAAAAAARALGWHPGALAVARVTAYIAGRDGIEAQSIQR
jgi:hypothetical protein